MDNINNADIVRSVRETSHLTRKELSAKINVPERSIANYELGKRTPTIDYLRKLGETFSVSPSYLLYGKGDMFYTSISAKAIDTRASGNIPKDAYKNLLLDIVEVVDDAIIKSGRKIGAAQKRKIAEHLYDAWIEIKGYNRSDAEIKQQEQSGKVIELKDFIEYNLPLAFKIITA